MAVTKIYAPSAFKITSSQHFQRHLGCLLNWVQQLARRENHMACGTRWSNLCNLVSEDLLWFVFVLICHDLSVSNTFEVRGHQTVPDFRKPEPVSNTTENFCSGFPTSEVSRNSSKEAVHSPLLSFANEENLMTSQIISHGLCNSSRSSCLESQFYDFQAKIEHSTTTEPK